MTVDTSGSDTAGPTGPLVGLKVLELAHLVAGPLAGSLMADLGAEVIHVEAPGSGDPARKVGPAKDGVPLWWKVGSRNKRSVTIDLRHPEGQDLARQLASWADIVVTSFRPSTLENWRLDHAALRTANPTIITLQVSALGATGLGREQAGFGKIGEARSGAAFITGSSDGPPILAGYLLSDAVAAMMGVIAAEAALFRRSTDPSFQGEWIDVALFEPLFRMIDWQVLAYDQLGVVPTRSGNDTMISEQALVETMTTAEGEWIVVSCGTNRSLESAAELTGASTATERRSELLEALRDWVARHTADECLEHLSAVGVSVSRIFSVADILRDPIYAARGDITTVDDPELGPMRMPAVLPHLREHPGSVWRAAPSLGQDNDLVFGSYLGMDGDEMDRLRNAGVI